MKKYSFILIAGLFLSLIFVKGNFTVQAAEESPDLCRGSTAAILFERSTNTVLYDKEIHRRLPPASMTKIMSLLLIYEALEVKQIEKTTMLKIGEVPTKVEGSKAFLSIGDEINVDELLKCICIASANDACLALAMHLCGSEEQFVTKMNDKAVSLGLKNTHFSDCTGLSNKNHYTTAYDLAVISDYLLDHFPDVLNYTNIKEDYIRKDTAKPFWLVNTNKMIGRVDNLDGLKTGYTSFSKYCITLHMTENNMSLISVVFGYEKSTTRNAESLELLRYGFANYKLEKLFTKGTSVKTISHILYKEPFEIVVKNDVHYLCKRSDKLEYTIEYDLENGKALVYNEGKLLVSGELISATEVKKRNFFELVLAVFKSCFS